MQWFELSIHCSLFWWFQFHIFILSIKTEKLEVSNIYAMVWLEKKNIIIQLSQKFRLLSFPKCFAPKKIPSKKKTLKINYKSHCGCKSHIFFLFTSVDDTPAIKWTEQVIFFNFTPSECIHDNLLIIQTIYSKLCQHEQKRKK